MNGKVTTYLLIVAVAALLIDAVRKPENRSVDVVAAETVHQRVVDSGVLRCGYFEEAPFTIKDPNTGDMSGIAIELAEHIATELMLTIEWIPVANFTTMTEDLYDGKFDAICASAFNLPRAGHIEYTQPYIFVPVKGYARAEHAAKLPTMNEIDWSQMRISGLDGEAAMAAARKRFPEAEYFVLPELSSIADSLTAVATGKADINFAIPTVFKAFDEHNPSALAPLRGDQTLHVYPVSFAIKPNEPGFRNMLDMVINNFTASGELTKLVDRYDPEQHLYRAQSNYVAYIK